MKKRNTKKVNYCISRLDWLEQESQSNSAIHERNPPTPKVRIIGGVLYEERIDDAYTGWISTGYVPTPTTRAQVFVYHLCMGLLMRYPFFSVLKFCLQNFTKWDFSEEAAEKHKSKMRKTNRN